jgi:hypothetical protein
MPRAVDIDLDSVVLEPRFRVGNFRGVTYVRGDVIERWWHRPLLMPPDEAGTGEYYLVRTPTMHQVDINCDTCVRGHTDKNTSCAAWLGIKERRYIDAEILYDPATGARHHFEVVSEHRAHIKAHVRGVVIKRSVE